MNIVLNGLLDLLFKHGADILNLDRNLIATGTEEIEDYKKCYFLLIPIMKPYYKINNSYYENR